MWLLLLSLVFPAHSAQCRHTSKRLSCVQYINNYDGDTISFNIPRLFPLFGEKVRVRVQGIDAPEIASAKTCERDMAQRAKSLVHTMLVHAKRIDLVYPKRDKFFRILADVQADGVSIAEVLLNKDLAVAYHGEAKPKTDWCKKRKAAEHLDLDFDVNTLAAGLTMPLDPYQGEWAFSGEIEPSMLAHHVKIYMNGDEARARVQRYMADGYICERRYGPFTLCRKLGDQFEIPKNILNKLHQLASRISLQFEPYDGDGSLITDGDSYHEWEVPAVVTVNGEKYDSYVFSKSNSGVVKASMGYEDKQKPHYSFVAARDTLKYYIGVAEEGKWEWYEYTAFAVLRSQKTQ